MLQPYSHLFGLCEESSFTLWRVKKQACQESDSPNLSQTAGDGMKHLLELSLSPPPEYKEAKAYHLHSLREEKLNPSLEIWIAWIWVASKPVLYYYWDRYYRALPHNVRLLSIWAWRITAVNNSRLIFSTDLIACLFLHWIANYSTEGDATLHLVLMWFSRSPHWLEEGIESVN